MTSQNSKTDNKESKFSGKAMSEEELAAYEKSFKEIEESIELVMENGEDL